MKAKGYVEAFSYVALDSLDLPGGREWIAKNKVQASLTVVADGG